MASRLSSHATVAALLSAGLRFSRERAQRASPFDPRDEEHQVAVDFGAVDELVDVAGVDRLRRLQAGRADAVARWNAAERDVVTNITTATANISLH